MIMRFPFLSVLLMLLAFAGCQTVPEERFDATLTEIVPEKLWRDSNSGRVPLGSDGYFEFPEAVTRVVVDVGAYKLRRTRKYLRTRSDTAIVAIEPMSDPWAAWTDDPRVVGVPVAVSLERGVLDFNVNKADVTSSLLPTVPGNLFEAATRTVEVRQVPAVRLEDILERIPPSLPIEFLKTDVQGMDLAVLMSAGRQLERVQSVQTEIMIQGSYAGEGPGEMATEAEFHEFMGGMGFSIVVESPAPERYFVDVLYQNERFPPPPRFQERRVRDSSN